MKKNKRQEIVLSVLSLVFSVLSTAIGYGFMGGANVSFAMKLMCGVILSGAPLFVTQFVLLTWRKNK